MHAVHTYKGLFHDTTGPYYETEEACEGCAGEERIDWYIVNHGSIGDNKVCESCGWTNKVQHETRLCANGCGRMFRADGPRHRYCGECYCCSSCNELVDGYGSYSWGDGQICRHCLEFRYR